MRHGSKDKMQNPSGASRADALPPGTPEWITPKLVRSTIETWQPFDQSPLTLDDAVSILRNVGRLFEVMSRDAAR